MIPKFLRTKPSDRQAEIPPMPINSILDAVVSDVEPPRMTTEDMTELATEYEVPRDNVLTALRVESSMVGFHQQSDGKWRPTVRLELHKLNEYTDGEFLQEHPHLFKAKFNISDSNGDQETQWRRIYEALRIVEGSWGVFPVLEAIGWGLGQVMGRNYEAAGSGTIQRFLARIGDSEREQAQTMLDFIENSGFRSALKERDWLRFAKNYNGSGNAVKYAEKLRREFQIVTGRRA